MFQGSVASVNQSELRVLVLVRAPHHVTRDTNPLLGFVQLQVSFPCSSLSTPSCSLPRRLSSPSPHALCQRPNAFQQSNLVFMMLRYMEQTRSRGCLSIRFAPARLPSANAKLLRSLVKIRSTQRKSKKVLRAKGVCFIVAQYVLFCCRFISGVSKHKPRQPCRNADCT